MIKIFKYVLAALVCATSSLVQAISVGEITSLIHTDETMLAKEVENTVDGARLVSLSIERISSPMDGGEVLPMDSASEILSTPANLILPGRGKDIFRIFYDGPKDDQERYYRLNWQDNPVQEDGLSKSAKTATATTSASIGTILVVAPRKETFDYEYLNGAVYNRGNVTFRVVAFGPCKTPNASGQKTCHERYYVMPGVGVKLKYGNLSDKKAHVGIWHRGNFITVNEGKPRNAAL
ncbi:MAG: hypothetical protein KBC57_00085 [Neisseriaceae bacterium]|nr:hypothetical protein [Neisseriaceae bacterium]MBP6860737.1 hypothetical protein [Neisseriaceae bacterium]